MKKPQRVPRVEFRKAIDEIGGEPLAGSGFETEEPDPDFSGYRCDQGKCNYKGKESLHGALVMI